MDSSNRIIYWTFCISLLVHAVFLSPIPAFNGALSKPDTALAMMYVALPPPAKIPAPETLNPKPVSKKAEPKKEISTKEKPAVSPMNASSKSEIRKDYPKMENRKETPATEPVKPAVTADKPASQPIITAKEPAKDLSKDKVYISYYKLVNEQLRQSAKCREDFSEGEIEVSFVVSSDGQLRSVEVLPDASCPDSFLRETAMQIVKKASPFPPFPDNLPLTQLTFNVVICFRDKS